MSEIPITSGGAERVSSAVEVLHPVFETDPVITYILHSMTPEARIAYLPTYFKALLKAASLNKAIFHEADGWRCCGVLMPPGCRVDDYVNAVRAGFVGVICRIGIGAGRRMIAEFQPLSDACKAKALAGQKKYYYVFFMGTRLDSRGRGLCSEIMRRYQDIAGKEGLPIWLEATTENSMGIYGKLGWKVVDVMVLGRGKVGGDGMPCKDGEGVKIWGMIWWPNGREVSS